jgi:Skp family chaperone for outer membrane proteins
MKKTLLGAASSVVFAAVSVQASLAFAADSNTVHYGDNNTDLTEEVKKLKLPTNAVESSKQGELIDSTGANGSTDSGNGSAESRPANGAGAGGVTAASTSEREGAAHGSSNRQVCSRESVASISQSDINEAAQKSSEASKVYIKLQQEYKSTKRTLDDAQNRYKTLPAGEAKENLRKEIDQLVKATNEKKKAYDSVSKTLEAAQAEAKNAKDFYIRKLAFEVVDEFRATGNSRDFSTWLARYSRKNNKYRVDGSHFAVGRQADLIMQDEARIKAIEFLEMPDSKTAFLNWKSTKPAHIDPTSVERLMGKGFESLANEQAVRGQLCLSKVHKAYVKERSEAQRVESEATLPERTSESARRAQLAGSVETVKCGSVTCKKAVEEAYINDMIAWQNNAVSKCGGKLTGTGVSNPDRLNDSAFNACAGLKPVFRNYEKGGPKYYLLKDPDYTNGKTPAVDPDTDGGK